MSSNGTSGRGRTLPDWRVVMLGPSRIGKTSLLTALQVAADEYFEGTRIFVAPSDDVTSKAFSTNNDVMLGELRDGRFSPQLKGTRAIQKYGLTVGLGDDAPSLSLTFTDFPGGYLTDKSSKVRELLSEASTVIVPVDATLLMEAGPGRGGAVVRGLNLDSVRDQVKMWAKRQAGRTGRVSLIIVPMKCEHYFADNGGRRDRSEELYDKVRQAYDGIVSGFRNEIGTSAEAHVLYAPVDTIGPVELIDVSWSEDSVSGEARMKPMYRVRKKRDGKTVQRRVMGAKPVLANLITDLLRVEEEVLENERRAVRRELLDRQREHEEEQGFWWSRFTDWIGGDGDRRLQMIAELEKDLGSVDDRLKDLTSSSSDLQGDKGRVRPWR